MPKSQRFGVGGKSIGSIKLSFNKRFQISSVDIEGRGDLIPMTTIRDSMMVVNNAVLAARGKRKRSRVVQKREDGIKAKEKAAADKAKQALEAKVKADAEAAKILNETPPKVSVQKPVVVNTAKKGDK